MGQNLHVAKKYDVEYVETSCDFYNKVHAFYELLAALGGEPNAVGSEDGMYSDYFECNVTGYEDAMQNLMVYIDDPTLFTESDLIKKALDEAGVTAEKALDIMRRCQQEADTRDGFIHFVSF